MIAVYVVTGLFLVWLAVVLLRVRQMALACRTAGSVCGNELAQDGVDCGIVRSRNLVVLLQDQAEGVECLVSRLAAGLSCCPEQRVTLVDGGSADATGLILERLARRYNMGYCRLAGDEPEFVRESVRLLDLRGIPGRDLRLCDLSQVFKRSYC